MADILKGMPDVAENFIREKVRYIKLDTCLLPSSVVANLKL